MDEQSLISSIAEIARNTWLNEKQPVLISNIPRQLGSPDFRAVLGKESLKNFLSRTRSEGNYKFVEDPLHKARIGIVPAGETYEFSTTSQQPTVVEEKYKGETMLRFLDLLLDLSEEDQRSVVIPLNVVAKLLRK